MKFNLATSALAGKGLVWMNQQRFMEWHNKLDMFAQFPSDPCFMLNCTTACSASTVIPTEFFRENPKSNTKWSAISALGARQIPTRNLVKFGVLKRRIASSANETTSFKYSWLAYGISYLYSSRGIPFRPNEWQRRAVSRYLRVVFSGACSCLATMDSLFFGRKSAR